MRKVPKWLQVVIIPGILFLSYQLVFFADNVVWLYKNPVDATGTGYIPTGMFWALVTFLLIVGVFACKRIRNISNF